VPKARRLVTSSMTSRDSMTSYSWRHKLQSRRIRKLGPATISVDHLSTHYRIEHCVKRSAHSA